MMPKQNHRDTSTRLFPSLSCDARRVKHRPDRSRKEGTAIAYSTMRHGDSGSREAS